MDQARSKVIKANPIGNGLDVFRASFNAICDRNRSFGLDAIEHLRREDIQNLVLILLSTLQIHPAARLLRSSNGRTLFNDLSRLNASITSEESDLENIKPLLRAALAERPDDAVIWDNVYSAVTESTPPRRAIPPSLKQTPWSQNTSSFVNSSEYRQNVDPVLKLELGPLYVGLPNFHETFFGGVPDLETASQAVFLKCGGGDKPLYKEGWSGWPTGAKESDVLTWLGDLIPKLEAFAGDCSSIPKHRRKLLAQPRTPLRGSTGKRSMDVGFVNIDITYNAMEENDGRYRWSHILVPGELKNNPEADKASIAWIDLATYAREVLAAQDSRRFVLAFTLCGSCMRAWEFDRLGGIASKQFDINTKDGGLQFVTTILGLLWMNEDGLGFDPTIITSGGQRYIEIERDGQIERLIIDKVMKRAPCIAGRATTCWKAHCKEDPQTPLVIKDSWQYTDRDEEGVLVQEATEKGVINVARYYHHETVRVNGLDDDIRNNVRKKLDVTKATNYRPGRQMLSSTASRVSRKGRSSSAGVKRPSSETNSDLPPSKRSCSVSPTKPSVEALPNRVHRRVILRDYGKPIYKASSRVALLAALEGCVEGHRSLYEAGLLHRDISINNLMVNENEKNCSWIAFLIDLDLAVREQREGASGAKGKTGTRAFMAIGALLGHEQHSFMHDLESFFWVLFWICVHYNGPNESRVVHAYEKWNYVDTDVLAKLKKGEVSDEGDFIRSVEENFTSYYQPLVSWVNRLRKVVFPNGKRWEKEDPKLYTRIKEVLREARKDSRVLVAT